MMAGTKWLSARKLRSSFLCLTSSLRNPLNQLAMLLNNSQRRFSGIACIGTQMFVPPIGGSVRSTATASSTASNCETSCRLAPVTTNVNGTPRPPTSKCRLLPFFFTILWLASTTSHSGVAFIDRSLAWWNQWLDVTPKCISHFPWFCFFHSSLICEHRTWEILILYLRIRS